MQEAVKAKLQDMVRLGVLELDPPGGVTNASSVVWQRKKNGVPQILCRLQSSPQWQSNGRTTFH